jgi:hypothetical protein
MGKYVYAYKGGSMPQTDAEREALTAAWTSWIGGLGDTFVDIGNPFGPSAAVKADGSNGAASSGLSGYSVIQASSLDDAVGKARGCPVFAGGGSVDVYETFEVM